MRVLFVVEDFRAIGGIQEVVDHVCEELIAMGHQAAVVSTPYVAPGAERARVSSAGCSLVEIPGRKAVTLRHLERLWRQPRASALAAEIASARPDVINSHVWTWDKLPSVALECAHARVPLVQSLHDTWGAGKLGRRALRAFKYAAAFTANTNATRSEFAALAPRTRRARVVYGGVDLAAADAAEPFRRDRAYIFCAARLNLAHRAFDVLADAFAIVAPEFPSLDLLIAGDGPDRESLAARVSALRLDGRVSLLGARPRAELWSLFKGARCVAMPSRMPEGMGLVFMESMACGRPAIASASGGALEIVRHGDNGLLVDRLEPDAWARAIRTMLSDAAAREAMGRRGYAMARERFSWRAVAERHLAAYRDALGQRR